MRYHQTLMNEAFSKWQSDMKSYKGLQEFIKSLPEIERDAVVLGALNYQVEDGGWLEWYENGYGVGIDYVYDAIRRCRTDLPHHRDLLNKFESLLDSVSRLVEKYKNLEKAYYSEADVDYLISAIREYNNGVKEYSYEEVRDIVEDIVHDYSDDKEISYDDVVTTILKRLEIHTNQSCKGDLTDVEELTDWCWEIYIEYLRGLVKEELETVEKYIEHCDKAYYEINDQLLNVWEESESFLKV